MNWAQRRKMTYLFGLLVTLFLIIGFSIRQSTRVTPTCFDKKQNQEESGIDCGGPCSTYCANELLEPKVRWVRTFEIRPGIVHAIAYIEHMYPTAAAQHVGYTFKIYDEHNTLITERSGTTFLGTMGRTAIVETLIKTGKATPALVRFSFTSPLPWEKVPSYFSQIVFNTDKTVLEPLTDSTRLTATITNESRISFRGLPVVAILYDAQDNAITTSQTLVPYLPAEDAVTASFTWPFKLSTPIARIEIIPRANPFTATSL